MRSFLPILALIICSSSFSQEQDSSKNQNLIFSSVEHPPQFPGGLNKFNEYIKLYMHNTEMAIGRINVQFVVETDGSLSDIRIVKSLCPLCDKEAIRVMQNCPKWIPGEQSGKKVRVKYLVTIIY